MRWLLLLLLAIGAGYGVGFAFGMNPSTPTDWVLNLGDVAHDDRLEAEQRGTLVVLQHGLWRSAASLGRMERALVDHGYDVLNFSYPSTEERIEQHAERLAKELHAELTARPGPPERIAFVGHSLGGLVIRSYLARDDAVDPWAVVFLGTPQRGASLATKRRELELFELVMGDDAALQLAPDSPFFSALGPMVACDRIGVIFGHRGDADGWNEDIPGDDDGTVGVREAQLPKAADAVGLNLGHTRLSFADASIVRVLEFLRTGRFSRAQDR